jgi:hypothetical protein
MSASPVCRPEEQQPEWLESDFWERLDRLEGRHQKAQTEHESARRGLDRVTPREAEELRNAWRRYCEVIDELDKTTEEFAALRRCSG